MSNLDNPAGLLRYWLVEQFGGYANKSEAIVNAACDLLGVERDRDGFMATLRLGVQLADLCRQVRLDVAELPEVLHAEMFLGDFDQIEGAVDHFTMARQHRVDAMLNSINPAGYRGLEYLDTFLHSHLRHPWIGEEQREELTDQVRNLIDDITADDSLDVETKDFVLSRLQEVESALREALVTGTVRIERATESLIGAMHRRPDLWERLAATRWGPRIKSLAIGLCMALSSVGGVPALMPGDTAEPPAVVQQVDMHVDVDTFHETGRIALEGSQSQEPQEADDVVDAEVVDEDEGPAGKP